MRRIIATLSLVALLLATTACSPIEKNARDTAAALQGIIIAAQTKYRVSCSSDPNQTPCLTINRGVSGENALVTSIELYCGWSTLAPPTDPNAKCVPVKTAEAALSSAIANAAQLTTEVKGVL